MRSHSSNTLFFLMLLNSILSVPLLAREDGMTPSQEATEDRMRDHPVRIVYSVVMPPSLFTRESHAGVLKGNTELLALVEEGFTAMTSHELADIGTHRIVNAENRHYNPSAQEIALTEEERAYLITKCRLFDLACQYVFYEYPIDNVIGTRSDWPILASILDKGLSTFTEAQIESIVTKWVQLPYQQASVEFSPEERDWLFQDHTVQVRVIDFPPFMILGQGEPQGISIDYLKLGSCPSWLRA